MTRPRPIVFPRNATDDQRVEAYRTYVNGLALDTAQSLLMPGVKKRWWHLFKIEHPQTAFSAASAVFEVHEWQRRCAARYVERVGMDERMAIQLSIATYETLIRRGGSPGVVSPESAADEDMSFWEGDGA